jgi:hypothetical protein
MVSADSRGVRDAIQTDPLDPRWVNPAIDRHAGMQPAYWNPIGCYAIRPGHAATGAYRRR